MRLTNRPMFEHSLYKYIEANLTLVCVYSGQTQKRLHSVGCLITLKLLVIKGIGWWGSTTCYNLLNNFFSKCIMLNVIVYLFIDCTVVTSVTVMTVLSDGFFTLSVVDRDGGGVVGVRGVRGH